jgi:hypothetical protein
MQRASKLALIGVAEVAITGAGTGIAVAASAGDDNEAPITGALLDQATELPGCGWQPAPGAARILAGRPSVRARCRSAET